MGLYLTTWLKKLILLVLLAAITDMLLPNTNFQKYARMVIGLLIILIMLAPILTIFNLDNFSASIAMNREILSLTNINNSDFSEIELAAAALNKTKQKEIAYQFAQNLQHEIAAQILTLYQTPVEVEATLFLNEKGEVKIDKIMVYLLGRVHKKDNKDQPYNPSNTIESIPAIEIKIGEENAHEADAEAVMAMNEAVKEIHGFLTSSYQLSNKQVEIQAK